MTYIKYSDYSGVRTRQTEEAQFRIRINVLNTFNTAFTDHRSAALSYNNLKAWYYGGYLSEDMLLTLMWKGIITHDQYAKITGDHSHDYELPPDEDIGEDV